MRVRLCHLYPREMNIYADRGNIAVLAQRLAWRGGALDVATAGPGEPVDDGYDLYYLGGGQDRDQALVAEDLAGRKSDALHSAAADGAAILCVCGGFQLAGAGYTGVDGARLAGMSLLDVDTIAGSTRLIGDLVIEAELDGEISTVVGYENHAGRTFLQGAASPLGRVLNGHGNNGDTGLEGAVSGHVIGTYLHGPLLPKNPWLADKILSWSLEHSGAGAELAPLDDHVEREAHQAAIDRAGVRR